MSQNIDLKQIERKVYVAFHQDGLIDLFLGFIMLVSVLSSTLSESGVSDLIRIAIYLPLMVVFGPVLYIMGKKYLTFPRMGYVKPGSRQTRKKRIVIFSVITAVLLTLVILTIIMGARPGTVSPVPGINVELWSSAMVTLIIFGIFSIIAFVLSVPRFYLLGLIMAMSEPLYLLSKHVTHTRHIGIIAYGIPGVILVVMGAMLLKRFIRNYPLPATGEIDNLENKDTMKK